MNEYTKQGYETAAKAFRSSDLDVDLKNKAIMITGKLRFKIIFVQIN
jgi:hypothetical protein